jgi:hypothetical protein
MLIPDDGPRPEMVERMLAGLAALSELECEMWRPKVARALEWRPSQLDRFVKHTRDRLGKAPIVLPAGSK